LAETLGAAPPAPPSPDFFAAQDAARARARRLFVLFALCVIAVVVAIDGYVVLVGAVVLAHDANVHGDPNVLIGDVLPRLPREVLLVSTAATAALILVASIQRRRELARGSETLAQSIGARAIAEKPENPAERQLRNVVEEMALASGGLPLAVYVLDGETAINAFAGASAREPFIVVTRGALDRLQRDEMQALVAYGISQLRNGDAKLNLQLVGWLAGITAIGDVGTRMVKAPYYVLRGGSGEDAGDLRKGIFGLSLAVTFLGMMIAAIGYVGVLLARFVRALASRQRVYLADATAVQYTRDPVAVRDLLRRVESEAQGGTLVGPYKEEFGPMLFVPGVKRLCLRTHPKLRQRIARLEQP
jgi:Zn-dependent protease with chaperone function